MRTYKNLSGNSGVSAYEYGNDYIKLRFKDSSIYTYTYSSAGSSHIEHMKKSAEQGRGLSTYVAQHVREDYERKE
ncbi:hypothetical protein GC163_14625 [bacterium]|nr:hypothetical protein [bacterium]